MIEWDGDGKVERADIMPAVSVLSGDVVDVTTGAVLKRIDYAYRPDGYVAAVTRFAGAGVNPIGIPKAAYDSMGRLTGITHAPSASPSIAYGYAYDRVSRITALTSPEGTSSFTLDATEQLPLLFDRFGNASASVQGAMPWLRPAATLAIATGAVHGAASARHRPLLSPSSHNLRTPVTNA
jgi:hypothetical protein